MSVPSSARAVVIGGGVIGTSIAYHLAKLGMKDVVLIERDKLTSGTTWHAAGLMEEFGSLSDTSTELRKYSKQLYRTLEQETGLSTGWKQCGFIELASNDDHMEQYRRVTAFNRLLGVEIEEITPSQIKDLFPLCNVDDIRCGFYVPDDGRVNPVDVTMSLAKGAKNRGVRFCEGVSVTKVIKKGCAVAGVETTAGTIECEYVVNCAGMWARQLAAKNNIAVFNQAAEHYYLLTEKMPEVSPDWPVIEDPGYYGYYREEGGGMLVGLFEPVCAPWKVGGIPEDSSFTTITPDWQRLAPYLEKAMSRVPATQNVGVKQLFCGPESFTPDLNPVVGEAPEMKNYFVCAGLNSIGIISGGGLGRIVAHWVINGKPDVDVCAMNITRVQPYQTNPSYLAERTVESLGLVYQCHYPYRAMTTGRNVRKGPIHGKLEAAGAYFKDVSGWEGADWYAPKGVDPRALSKRLTWGRADWWHLWKSEHEAVRTGVILMDMSFMCKFSVEGPDSGKALNWISANNVDAAANRITYTQWLNEDGCLEADLTVAKLGEDKFFVVATDTALRHVQAHFRKHAPAHVRMHDISSGIAQLNIQGPRSRELLSKITSVDMSNEAFPFRQAQEIDIGFAKVLCIRITYLGELGYELYVPAEQATHVYDIVVEAGKSVELRHAGLKALASCRMEKGYKDFGHDLDNTDSVLDAQLGFAVSMKKPGGFVGKESVLKHKESGNVFKRRLLQVQCLDPEPLMYGAEPVLCNGIPAGYVRCASYGHTLGGAVGLAMLRASNGFSHVNQEFIDASKWSVNVAGKEYPAKVSIDSLYDPKMKRVLA